MIFVLFALTQQLLKGFKARLRWLNLNLMNKLFWYHMFFAGVYYTYAAFNPSDSAGYFRRPQSDYDDWLSIYQTGTKFLDFINYPIINYLHFSYEMMMVLYAWLGFWGFVYFYIFFKENLTFKHKWQGYDLLTLIFFLPNMHFWTASLGKGSIMFFGLGMAIYGLSRMNIRRTALVMGLLIVYQIRPHVFLFMAVAIIVGLFTGRQKVPFYQKFLVLAGSSLALILMFDQIMAFAGLDSDNLVESFDQFASHRSGELAKAGSGINISNYPLVFKLFTFWYRPLFVDAPNPIGLIVSMENLLYLILTAKLFKGGFFKFLRKGPALVKTCAVIFLATSFALSGTLSNLGIIIRQKSMIMYFFLFVILAFLDFKKARLVQRRKLAAEKKQQEEASLLATNEI